MADQQRTFSDDELLGIFNSDEDMSVLTPAEQARMLRLTERRKAPEPKKPEPADPKNDSFTDWLPTAGGAVGGLLGGSKASPIGMALAGVGGAGGEAYKQVIDSLRGNFAEVPETIGGRLKKIGTEGLKQAGYEGGGRVLNAALVRPAAKLLYGTALRPSASVARDVGGGSVLRGFDRIASQGLDDAVLPSALGVGRASRKAVESSAEAAALAAKSPAEVATKDILRTASTDQTARMAKEAALSGERARPDVVAQRLSRIYRANPPRLNMSKLLEMRQGADRLAKPAFAAAKIGGTGSVPLGGKASVAKSVGDAAREKLNATLGDEFSQINFRTMTRRGVEDAVKAAAARPNVLQNMVAGAGGVGSAMMSGNPSDALMTYALLRALASPNAAGGLGIALSRLPAAQALRVIDPLQQEE